MPGPLGPQGPTGPTGPTGAASTVTGPTGPTGPAITGPTGAASTVTGPTGPTGANNGITYTVTTNGSSSYVINNVSSPTITVIRGMRYIFNLNAAGHPFHLQRSGVQYDVTQVYTDGITNPGTASGTITWDVLFDAPASLTYQSQYQSNMRGVIVVSDAGGPTGPQGAASTVEGPTGPTGPSVTGPQGAASTVAGPTGPQGATGPTGAASTVTGPTGATGAASNVTGPTGPAFYNLVSTSSTSSRALTLADVGTLVEMNSAAANTLTIPLDASVNFPIGTQLIICQIGTGRTSIAATAGVTVVSELQRLTLSQQYAAASLIKRAANSWILIGSLAD